MGGMVGERTSWRKQNRPAFKWHSPSKLIITCPLQNNHLLIFSHNGIYWDGIESENAQSPSFEEFNTHIN